MLQRDQPPFHIYFRLFVLVFLHSSKLETLVIMANNIVHFASSARERKERRALRVSITLLCCAREMLGLRLKRLCISKQQQEKLQQRLQTAKQGFRPFDNVQKSFFSNTILARFRSLSHSLFPISFLPDLSRALSLHHHHCWRCKRIEYCVLLIVQGNSREGEMEKERRAKNGRDCVTLLYFFFALHGFSSCLNRACFAVSSSLWRDLWIVKYRSEI